MKDYYYGIIGGILMLIALWTGSQNGNETIEFALAISGVGLMITEAYKKWKKA